MTLLLNDIISTDAEHRDTDPLEQCNQQCNSATVQQCNSALQGGGVRLSPPREG